MEEKKKVNMKGGRKEPLFLREATHKG